MKSAHEKLLGFNFGDIKDKTYKLAPGYYEGYYKGKHFTISKVEGQNQWYWLYGKEGGKDWFSCKKFALAAVKQYIDET